MCFWFRVGYKCGWTWSGMNYSRCRVQGYTHTIKYIEHLMDGAMELHQTYKAHFIKGLEREQRKLLLHYRFSLLHRRFVFRKVEASDWWWAARDHGKDTDCRWSPLSPSRLPLRARERRLGTRQLPISAFVSAFCVMSFACVKPLSVMPFCVMPFRQRDAFLRVMPIWYYPFQNFFLLQWLLFYRLWYGICHVWLIPFHSV